MIKGGYKILDLGEVDLTTSQTIPGAYYALSNAHRKPILLSGIVVGGVDYPDVFTSFQLVNSVYTAPVTLGSKTYNVTVSDADSVSVAAKE